MNVFRFLLTECNKFNTMSMIFLLVDKNVFYIENNINQIYPSLPPTTLQPFLQTGSTPWTVRAQIKKLGIATYFEGIF